MLVALESAPPSPNSIRCEREVPKGKTEAEKLPARACKKENQSGWMRASRISIHNEQIFIIFNYSWDVSVNIINAKVKRLPSNALSERENLSSMWRESINCRYWMSLTVFAARARVCLSYTRITPTELSSVCSFIYLFNFYSSSMLLCFILPRRATPRLVLQLYRNFYASISIFELFIYYPKPHNDASIQMHICRIGT